MKNILAFIFIVFSICASAQNPIMMIGNAPKNPQGVRMMTDPVTGNITSQSEVVHQPCDYATDNTLPANTYASGVLTATSNAALVINGTTVTVGQRILVMWEANQAHNNIYTVTQVGDGSHPYILTTGGFSSIAANMAAMSEIFIKSGYYAGTTFYQSTTGAITIGTSPLIFSSIIYLNVKNFGAYGDGVHDDTPAFIAAAKATKYIRGSRVWIPTPINYYLIAGPIDSTSYGYDCNCQIPIPVDSSESNRTRIMFTAEVSPNFSWTGPLQTVYNPAKGVVLKSTYAGTRSQRVKGTAVFGSNGPNIGGIGNGENLNYLTVENINIVVKNNPNGNGPEIGGVNYRHGASVQIRNCTYSVDTAGELTTVPIENVSGFETSDCDNEIDNTLNNLQASGAPWAFIIGEHTSGDQLSAYVCYNGIGTKWGNHSSSLNRVLVQWSTNGISYVDQGSSCNITPLAAMNIENFDFEPSGSCYSSKWYNTRYAINDSLNRITGNIRYWQSVCGTGGNGNASWTVNGATNFKQIALGSAPGAASAVGGDQAIQYDSLGFFSGNKSMLSINYSTGNISQTMSVSGGLKFTQTNINATGSTNFLANSDTYGTEFGQTSHSYSTYGALVANGGFVYSTAPHFNIFDDIAGGIIGLAAGSGAAAQVTWNGTAWAPVTTTSYDLGTSSLVWRHTYVGDIHNSATQTSVGGSTSGTANFSEPEQGSSYKKIIVFCNALNGTAAYTYLTAFTQTPTITFATSGITASSGPSTSAVTLSASTVTGWVVIEGY